MKKVSFVSLLPVILSIFLLFESDQSSSAASAESRLGVKGKMVLIVTQIAPFVSQSEIQAGDVITDVLFEEQNDPSDGSKQCDLSTIADLQKVIAESRVGTPIRIEFLRFDPLIGNFENHVTKVQTLAALGSQSRSTIGLVGEMGFMIEDVDPSTPQAEVRAGDIMLSIMALGQVTDLETFREAVRTSKAGSTIKAEVLRHNSALKNAERRTVSLKLYPYPSVPMNVSTTSSKGLLSFTRTSSSQGCPQNPCVWCCAQCVPYPWSSACGISQCETGRTELAPQASLGFAVG